MHCRTLIHATVLVALTACALPRREVISARSAANEMNVYRAEAVHVSILVPPREVVEFLADVNNWKTWAPWIRTVSKASARDWTVETDGGTLQMRFVEANALGVLDHTVSLASGVSVYNAMRVSANGAGSELSMVVLQTPPASNVEFERDVQAVRDDFARIKKVLEGAARR